jgi:hypothetical protein
MSVKEELVVAADRIHVEEVPPVLAGFVAHEPPANFGLAQVKGARRQVDEDLRSLSSQLVYRLTMV